MNLLPFDCSVTNNFPRVYCPLKESLRDIFVIHCPDPTEKKIYSTQFGSRLEPPPPKKKPGISTAKYSVICVLVTIVNDPVPHG